MPDVFEVERVGNASSNEKTSADNAEHSVRDPSLVDELLREPSDADAEILVREDLKLRLRRRVRCHGCGQSWVRWKLANERDGVGPRCPWYREPYFSEPYGCSAGEERRNRHNWPIFMPG